MPDEGGPDLGALHGFDRLLEHRVRLAICVLLARGEEIAFTRFKNMLGETDGNLGANLQRLEEAGYVRSRKAHVGRKPITWYVLTAQGRRALARHLEAFDALTRDAISS